MSNWICKRYTGYGLASLTNQIRGFLLERGIIVRQGLRFLRADHLRVAVLGLSRTKGALHVEPALIRPRESEFRAARSRRSNDRFAVDMEKAKSEINR
jgi:hypothetical protein